MSRTAEPRQRETFAERRARRAGIDDPQVVLNVAARFLEVRSRSVEEVRRHLLGSGYRSELVEGAIDRLLELGILNDDAFARAWVESRFRARPRSSRVLRDELARKGVARAAIDDAMARHEESHREPSPGEPETERSVDEQAAERLLARHGGALRRETDPRARRQRAYALLARNGFDPDVCRDVANRFVALASGEGPDQ
ncbi:MAG: regulatory protein RecX [Candidatus Limnocylindrales bacterium]|jgi:regulatory protein